VGLEASFKADETSPNNYTANKTEFHSILKPVRMKVFRLTVRTKHLFLLYFCNYIIQSIYPFKYRVRPLRSESVNSYTSSNRQLTFGFNPRKAINLPIKIVTCSFLELLQPLAALAVHQCSLSSGSNSVSASSPESETFRSLE